MERNALRKGLALVTCASLLASLTITFAGAPASAAKPKCAGKTATIVGTKRSETIRGTARADVIKAKGGNDIILGRGGNDIICGDGGKDRLVGGPGNDRLYGGAGNDRLDGGPGRDVCRKGTGGGPLVRCEIPQAAPQTAPQPAPQPAPAPTPTPTPSAPKVGDLKVTVSSPATVDAGETFVFHIVTRNKGDKRLSGTLEYDQTTANAKCNQDHALAPTPLTLDPLEAFPIGLDLHCQPTSAGAKVTLSAKVKPSGEDANASNDSGQSTTTVSQ